MPRLISQGRPRRSTSSKMPHRFKSLSAGCCVRRGFTIVELLVVVTVIGILFALIIPAVQMARESARKAHCRNNLRQVAIASLNFAERHQQFPGNGWGFGWVGENGRAAGRSQPGGWIYQLLPDLDQASTWQLGSDSDPALRRESLKTLCETPLLLMKCPSRPCSQKGPPSRRWAYRNANAPSYVVRTDYAINEGDFLTRTSIGPATLAEGDDPAYIWTDVTKASGVSWLRGGARPGDITDGTSNTILAGEKYVSTLGYSAAFDRGYDQSLYSGVDLDLARWSIETPAMDSDFVAERSFGSAHSQACFLAFCDGSVRSVSYEIDSIVFRWMGNRKDGNVANIEF